MESATPPPQSSYYDDLTAMVRSAADIPDAPQRDAALVAALRTCRCELEAAESEHEAARLRLSDARDTFDAAAKMLSDIPPSLGHSLQVQNVTGAGAGGVDGQTIGKRGRDPSSDAAQFDGKRSRSSSAEGEDEEAEWQKVDVVDAADPVPVPTNPIHIPASHTSTDLSAMGANVIPMSEELVAAHREAFYQQTMGISWSEVDYYTPKINSSNTDLRSKSQLAEGIYVAQHWYVGDPSVGLSAYQFQRRHQKWKIRMMPVNSFPGRRTVTGTHVRTLEGGGGGEVPGATVLCRYDKDWAKSVVYLDVTQLYDALFELHCLEDNHKSTAYGSTSKEQMKSRVDGLYANIPYATVCCFLETCPICN